MLGENQDIHEYGEQLIHVNQFNDLLRMSGIEENKFEDRKKLSCSREKKTTNPKVPITRVVT